MSFGEEIWHKYGYDDAYEEWERMVNLPPPPPPQNLPPHSSYHPAPGYHIPGDYPHREDFPIQRGYHPAADYPPHPGFYNYYLTGDYPPPANYPSQTNYSYPYGGYQTPRSFPAKRTQRPNPKPRGLQEQRLTPSISPAMRIPSSNNGEHITQEERERRLKKFLPQKRERFEEYLKTLIPEEQEFARNVAEQVVKDPITIILPDSELFQTMIPLPSQFIPEKSSIFPNLGAIFSFDPESCRLSELLDESKPVINDSIKLPPWPEKSSLIEVNMHYKMERDIGEIVSALATDSSESNRFFGHFIGDEIKKIDPQKREAVALRILDQLKDSELAEPLRKRTKIEIKLTEPTE